MNVVIRPPLEFHDPERSVVKYSMNKDEVKRMKAFKVGITLKGFGDDEKPMPAWYRRQSLARNRIINV